jgi:hypothetical protein
MADCCFGSTVDLDIDVPDFEKKLYVSGADVTGCSLPRSKPECTGGCDIQAYFCGCGSKPLTLKI